ncbi:MAG: hypothetical protein GKS06_02350 [Acidobacteria bacterium]|nr:hypothetical protein [Acidobacteriota bacterium]
MSNGVMFIGVAALAGGCWSALMNRAAADTNPLLAPMIAEATGVFIALTILVTRYRDVQLEWTSRGVGLLLLAGVCVFSVDYFTVRAYGTGLAVSTGAPIFLGGAILVTTIIGPALGDQLSGTKLAGIALVAAGAVMLGTAGE